MTSSGYLAILQYHVDTSDLLKKVSTCACTVHVNKTSHKRSIQRDPVLRKRGCERDSPFREPGNVHDPYAVAVTKENSHVT